MSFLTFYDAKSTYGPDITRKNSKVIPNVRDLFENLILLRAPIVHTGFCLLNRGAGKLSINQSLDVVSNWSLLICVSNRLSKHPAHMCNLFFEKKITHLHL
ncbi:hypothetical protein XENOCAPTIV_010699 [Xenoophorus captivus]|uniref:Uncharacterized protein n=1 Tax=Xenoophorus captivus TaxID=1517983 RepID=A0ABV0SEI9_9TELE